MKLFKYISCFLLLGLTLKANAYYTSQGNIYDRSGNKININGVSWSGFQDTNVFQGLQSNPFYNITMPQSKPRNGLMDLLTTLGYS
nr:hypothetical protein [Legionella norrlandica]